MQDRGTVLCNIRTGSSPDEDAPFLVINYIWICVYSLKYYWTRITTVSINMHALAKGWTEWVVAVGRDRKKWEGTDTGQDVIQVSCVEYYKWGSQEEIVEKKRGRWGRKKSAWENFNESKPPYRLTQKYLTIRYLFVSLHPSLVYELLYFISCIVGYN